MQRKFFVIVFITGLSIKASCQQDARLAVAEKIAQKMKDSLILNDGQKQEIYTINLGIANQKIALRSQYAVASDSLRINTQKVENSRDSLYRQVLTAEQYQSYQQKKRQLVSNN